MILNKSIKLVLAGAVIGFANVSIYPVNFSSAEEVVSSESTTQLQTLRIEEFQLEETFSSSKKAYTALVTSDIHSMTLLLEAKEESASITVNGKAVVSGEKSSFSLNAKENLFTIIVANGSEVSSYTITVSRAQNDNIQLADLVLSSGDLVFNPAVTNYHLKVDNETSNITVYAKAASDTAKVEINGTKATSKGLSVDIPVGSTTITIIVTAENGNKKTYQITITREEPLPKTPTQPITTEASSRMSQSQVGSLPATNSGNAHIETTANLDSLTVSNGTWNKSFTSDQYTYHLAVGNDVTNVSITAKAEESNAEITIDESDISSSSDITIKNQEKTVISVVVTNDDERKTYVLVFDKDIEKEEDTVDTDVIESLSATEDFSSDKIDLQLEREQPNDNSVLKPTDSRSLWQRILAFFGL
ncbi:hypothetical protein J27TS8_24540 [Robertmurraya siralis]|uniref:Cadherin-like beta-sandwich-like domain-containing protein n=1 Tax=Robertmurraya siralis TaxID=77777 RepID=A0A919WIR4_9BACI|nr:cadherin-like beta sandwich domain-containing protein [Robertmurraya siralis]PAE20430.1 hypothetical protein CHH80_11525 [Bacillus sp. 7504-2]GIN62461.1 hypothetical protein J27TS8_24540 [Robertmurraya siralis]